MGKGTLTTTQLAVAEAFFREARGFFLTGGAVLAGWELAHRPTDDLDLFTGDDESMAQGDAALRRAVDQLGGSLEAITTSPDFRRYVIALGADRLKIDLVRDRIPQLRAKVQRDGITMDSAEEIFVNKICTLVERSEIRDLVDVMLLERRGFKVEDALPLAQSKDAGVTAATLAWLLHDLVIPEAVPAGLSKTEVGQYREALEARLLVLARQAPH